MVVSGSMVKRCLLLSSGCCRQVNLVVSGSMVGGVCYYQVVAVNR